MSITTEASSSTNKSTRTNITEHIDEIPNVVDDHNKTLVIILAVTLPTLACIALLILLIVCYRRRYTAIWLKKSQNSSRLQAIVVNLSPTSIQSEYSEKKLCLSYPQFQQPRTKTIVYNRLSASSSSIVNSPFKVPIKGETNAAFDEYLFKNEQQPILRSSSTIGQPTTTTLQTDFPVSFQAPVLIITSAFVEAIAKHRLSLLSNTNSTSSEISASTSTSNSSRHSGTSASSSSYSNSSQRLLLFSQRTEF